jgi:choline kinase
LFNYRGKTVIEHQLDTIYAVYPTADITLVLGFEATKIYKKIFRLYPKIRYIFVENYDTHNQVYSILQGVMSSTTTNLLLIYGDILFNKSTINKLELDKSYLLSDTNQQMLKDRVGINGNNSRVSILHHGIKNKWAQIAIFAESELTILKRLLLYRESYKWLGYEAINYIIKNGGSFTLLENKRQNIKEISNIQDTL